MVQMPVRRDESRGRYDRDAGSFVQEQRHPGECPECKGTGYEIRPRRSSGVSWLTVFFVGIFVLFVIFLMLPVVP